MTDKKEKKDESKGQEFNLIPKIINGGIAGIVGVTSVFPLDLCKTRLQNQTIGPNGEKQYKSLMDCLTKTFRNEGFRGMYRGLFINTLLITPEKAIKLSGNDFFRYHLTLPDGSLPVYRQMLAGGLVGAFQIVVTTPMELLKIAGQDAGRVAAEAKAAGKLAPKSAFQIAIELYKKRGIMGLYQGTGATAARDVSFSICYFPLFATFNNMGYDAKLDAVPFWWTLCSGLLAGSIGALIVTPADVVKSRLQSLAEGTNVPKYKGFIDCAIKTYQHEGALAFFKGGACRMMVIAPLFGIAQTVYFLGIAESLLGYEKVYVK